MKISPFWHVIEQTIELRLCTTFGMYRIAPLESGDRVLGMWLVTW